MEEEDSSSSDNMDDTREWEEKRNKFTDDMTDLQEQYDILREKLYLERSAQIESKMAEVLDGYAPEYLQRLEELEKNMINRIETNTVLKEMKLASIDRKFEADQLATQQNFQSEKILLYEKMREKLEKKIHVLEETKTNVDFSTEIWKKSNSGKKSSRLGSRHADPMDPDQRKKPVIVKGPYIVYMLHENEILEDWAIIMKSLAQK